MRGLASITFVLCCVFVASTTATKKKPVATLMKDLPKGEKEKYEGYLKQALKVVDGSQLDLMKETGAFTLTNQTMAIKKAKDGSIYVLFWGSYYLCLVTLEPVVVKGVVRALVNDDKTFCFPRIGDFLKTLISTLGKDLKGLIPWIRKLLPPSRVIPKRVTGL